MKKKPSKSTAPSAAALKKLSERDAKAIVAALNAAVIRKGEPCESKS